MAGIVNQPTGPPVQEHNDRRLELVWFESQVTKLCLAWKEDERPEAGMVSTFE